MVNVDLTIVEIGVLLSIFSALVAAVLGISRPWLNSLVESKVDGRVDVAVGQAVALIGAKLDGIRLNQEENSAALGRVHDLEVTIKNGLQAEVDRIGRQVDGLVKHHAYWSGDERRSE